MKSFYSHSIGQVHYCEVTLALTKLILTFRFGFTTKVVLLYTIAHSAYYLFYNLPKFISHDESTNLSNTQGVQVRGARRQGYRTLRLSAVAFALASVEAEAVHAS